LISVFIDVWDEVIWSNIETFALSTSDLIEVTADDTSLYILDCIVEISVCNGVFIRLTMSLIILDSALPTSDLTSDSRFDISAVIYVSKLVISLCIVSTKPFVSNIS